MGAVEDEIEDEEEDAEEDTEEEHTMVWVFEMGGMSQTT